MKGRDRFTRVEVDQIRRLLRRKQTADRDTQKRLRGQLRKVGFYISDFSDDPAGFTVSDFDLLAKQGRVRIADGEGQDAAEPLAEKERPPRRSGSAAAPGGVEPPPRSGTASPPDSPAGSGNRVIEEWMGKEVETLRDLLRPGLRAVIVGINPSPVSVAAGHYYQGRLGQLLYARLRRAGALPEDASGFGDDALFERGIGFTDIVKRPTRGEKEVRREEFDHGAPLLREKLEASGAGLVIFTFKKTAKKLFGAFEGNGFVAGLELAGASVFVMPGPYESAAVADKRLEELARWLAAD